MFLFSCNKLRIWALIVRYNFLSSLLSFILVFFSINCNCTCLNHVYIGRNGYLSTFAIYKQKILLVKSKADLGIAFFKSMSRHLWYTLCSHETTISTPIPKSLLSVNYAGGLAWQVLALGQSLILRTQFRQLLLVFSEYIYIYIYIYIL